MTYGRRRQSGTVLGAGPAPNPMTTETTSPVPPHVEEAVATIAALHAAHHREDRALQKAVSIATSGIAQPATLVIISVAIASWVTLNLALPEFGRSAIESRSFAHRWAAQFAPSASGEGVTGAASTLLRIARTSRRSHAGDNRDSACYPRPAIRPAPASHGAGLVLSRTALTHRAPARFRRARGSFGG